MDGLFAWLVMAVLLVVPLWKICGRAGFAPALALIAAVPFIGIVIVAALLGFIEWPRSAHRLPPRDRQ